METVAAHRHHVEGCLKKAGLRINEVTDRHVYFVAHDEEVADIHKLFSEGRIKEISWPALIAAAEQQDEELAAPYMDAWKQAATALQELPRNMQGLRVDIYGPTDAHMGPVGVWDAAGQFRSDFLFADEGSQRPLHLAEQDAAAVRERLKRPEIPKEERKPRVVPERLNPATAGEIDADLLDEN